MVGANGRRVSSGSRFSKHFHMANGWCKQTEKDKSGYNYTGKADSTLDLTLHLGWLLDQSTIDSSVQLGACLGSCVYEIMAQSGSCITTMWKMNSFTVVTNDNYNWARIQTYNTIHHYSLSLLISIFTSNMQKLEMAEPTPSTSNVQVLNFTHIFYI